MENPGQILMTPITWVVAALLPCSLKTKLPHQQGKSSMFVKTSYILLLSFCVLTTGYTENLLYVSDSRTDESIQYAFEKHKQEIYSTYSHYLESVPDLSGRVIYHIAVAPDGTVRNCQLKKTTIHDYAFLLLIEDIICNIDFGRVRDPELSTFDYPLEFMAKS